MSLLPANRAGVRRLRRARRMPLLRLAEACLATLLALGGVGVPEHRAAAQLGADYPVPGGWYYTQATVRAGFGYSVVDDAMAPMWTEYRRLGGPEVLGFPVSRRYFGPDGLLYQGFERFVLQWRPDEQRAVIANLYEQFTEAGLDDFLLARGIPHPLPSLEATFIDESRRRMGWLTESRFLGFYLLNPLTQEPWEFFEQAWEFYGLPQTGAERLRVTAGGPALWPFIVQRFQKAVFQLWLEPGPGIAPGTVTIVTGGTLARQAGLIPITAAIPEPPPASLPYLVGQPQLSGAPIAIAGQTLQHFVLAGAGFSPGEPVTVTLVREIPPPASEQEPKFTLTRSAIARPDGTFVVEGDTLPGTYSVAARGRVSGVSAFDTLVLGGTGGGR